MSSPQRSRLRLVTRRTMLKTTLGAGAASVLGAACANADAEVFAGEVATPIPTTTTTTTAPPTTTAAPSTTAGEVADGQAAPSEPLDQVAAGLPAVNGEMVISFTYTRALGGKLESPYVAVWIEDDEGFLVETVALYYQQERRGARWLDHLDRWFLVDAQRIADGGANTAAAISSATRQPGTYDVAWDGQSNGEAVPTGLYYVCIEAAREEGPYSLIREPFQLEGSLAQTALPDNSELSAASVLING